MRFLRTLCYVAVVAALLSPALRADDWNKLTYLTFSGPVQVPGATLPAGTYMFKLADPDTGRRAIQIWDEKGTKLYTTLLSIPDQMFEAKDDPYVSFTERPSGEPAAIRAWFYPGERTGYEFVYPKDQAMRIAKATNTPVLAHADESFSGTDLATAKSAKVGRIDEQGNFANERSANAGATAAAAPTPAATTSSETTATTSAQNRTAAPAEPSPAAAAAPAPSANRTEPQAAAPTTATATTATEPEPQAPTAAAAPASATPVPSANRSASPAAGTRVARGPEQGAKPVGTAGRADQAEQLPRTASDLSMLQVLSGLSLVGALALRRLRSRLPDSRA